MTLAAGITEYTLGIPPVTGVGVSWSAAELDTALVGPIRSTLFDHDGMADITALLESLPATDFESDELTKILKTDLPPKNWEAGEAIAEVFLTHHRSSHFPWPDGRDIRKPKSSLPGADLIGFHGNDTDTKFAFGEVKTSHESKYPPQIVRYGEHSLNKQLTDLRDKKPLRDAAVRYLGHRATRADWQETYKNAAKNYLKTEGNGIALFGVLIRDVPSHPDDLDATRQLLAEDCPPHTLIELLAIYLPPDSINSLRDKIMGGDT